VLVNENKELKDVVKRLFQCLDFFLVLGLVLNKIIVIAPKFAVDHSIANHGRKTHNVALIGVPGDLNIDWLVVDNLQNHKSSTASSKQARSNDDFPTRLESQDETSVAPALA